MDTDIQTDLRSRIVNLSRTDYISVWDLLELVCQKVELEMQPLENGLYLYRPKETI